MTDVEAAQAEKSLPPSPAEASPLLDVEPEDLRTEIRSVVECVVTDSFDPMIRDLEEVAGGESA
jgi:hypothetical protein